MKTVLSLSVFLMVGISVVAFATDLLKYSWEDVPNSDYYQGIEKNSAGEFSFRTKENELLFKEGSEILLNAYDENDQLLQKVKALPKTKGPSTQTREEENISFQDEDYYKCMDAECAGVSEDVEKIRPSKPEEETKVAEEPPAKPVEINTEMSLNQIFGKEKLSAKGGVSDFNGSSTVVGPRFNFHIDFLQPPEPLFIDWLLDLHLFKAGVKEEIKDVTADNEVKTTYYTRIFMVGMPFYKLNFICGQEAKHLCGAGFGFGYLRMPILKISDELTGAAALQNKTFSGIGLGVKYRYSIDDGQKIGASFLLLPYLFSAGSASKSMELAAFWQYIVWKNIFLEAGFSGRNEVLTTKVTCPEVNKCTETSRTTSTLYQGNVGAGVVF